MRCGRRAFFPGLKTPNGHRTVPVRHVEVGRCPCDQWEICAVDVRRPIGTLGPRSTQTTMNNRGSSNRTGSGINCADLMRLTIA